MRGFFFFFVEFSHSVGRGRRHRDVVNTYTERFIMLSTTSGATTIILILSIYYAIRHISSMLRRISTVVSLIAIAFIVIYVLPQLGVI